MKATGKTSENHFLIYACLFVILFVALFLRLVGMQRKGNTDYHPDEWVIARPVYMIANKGQVGLKAHYKWPACSVIYPLGYTLYGLKSVFGPYSYNNILIIQRAISAVAGTLAVLITYLLMRRIFSLRAALFAASLLAVARLPVFQGHYGTITSIVSLIILTVMLLCRDIFDVKPEDGHNNNLKLGRCCFLGFLCGIGIAAKWTILLAAIPFFVAFSLSTWFNRGQNTWGLFVKANLKRISTIIVTAAIGFLVGLPDLYFAPDKVFDGLEYEAKHHQTGHYGSATVEDMVFSARCWKIFQIVIKTGSIYFFIPFVLAFFVFISKLSRWRVFLAGIFILWMFVIFRNKIVAERHLLVPFIIMVLIVSTVLGMLVSNRRKILKVVGYGTFIFLLFTGLLYTCISISPFWKPDAKIECFEWIKANIPSGSGLSGVPWNPVPRSLAQIYPQRAEKGKKQYIIVPTSEIDKFKKHPPERKIIPQEWFPSKPPDRNVFLMYAEMNAGGGPNLALVKKFDNKPSFLGLDLRLFGYPPEKPTTSANRSFCIFVVKNKPNS